MSGLWSNVLALVLTFVIIFGGCLLARGLLGQREVHHNSWAATLSYIATAYGVVIGFSILFLFGQYANAKHAVGDEATSVGTAYSQASLFPGGESVQRALICYGRAVSTYDWPTLEKHQGGSPKVDAAYHGLVASVGRNDQPPVGALHSAMATNLAAQIGSISTARETRLVTAENRLPPLLWILTVGGGAFVVITIFVLTLPAGKGTQAGLVSMAAVFTVVLVLIVLALSNPFTAGSGRVTPRLIEETVASISSTAPAVIVAPCSP